MNNSVKPKMIYILLLLLALTITMAVAIINYVRQEDRVSENISDATNSTIVPESDDLVLEAEPEVPMSDGYPVIGGREDCYHYWGEWILIRASTLMRSGNELRYCSGCGACQNREFGAVYVPGKSAYIDVKCKMQLPNFPNGCEVVSLTMVLNYLGYDVTTDTLIDDHLPKGVFSTDGDNPFYKYLGDPRSLGVGCYAPCIVNCANNYFTSIGEFVPVTDVSGRGFEIYKKYISEGTPVIFWGTTYMDCDPEVFGVVSTAAGDIIWRNHSHCFVMIGYTERSYIFCDPLRGIVEYPKEDVENSHDLVYEQACIIQK